MAPGLLNVAWVRLVEAFEGWGLGVPAVKTYAPKRGRDGEEESDPKKSICCICVYLPPDLDWDREADRPAMRRLAECIARALCITRTQIHFKTNECVRLDPSPHYSAVLPSRCHGTPPLLTQ